MTETRAFDKSERDARERLDKILPDVGEGFNVRLKTTLLDTRDMELTQRSDPAPRPRHAYSFVGGAAAAAFLIALAWLIVPDFTSRPTAWAEVVTAVTNLRHFSVTVYEERKAELRRTEGYYLAPDSWRVHHMSEASNQVIFVTRGGSGRFDVDKKVWSQRSADIDFSLMPANFSKIIEAEGLLAAVLKSFFRQKTPHRTPVRNTAESERGELEVFDLVDDASSNWMRVWVLPRSRLPIRAKTFEPSLNRTSTLEFDYADPRSGEFFDLKAFGEKSQEAGLEPYETFRIGERVVAGRSRSTRELHQVDGIRVPRVLDVISNRPGDILIRTDDPRNRSPKGFRLRSRLWKEAHDSVGNLYLRFSSASDKQGNVYSYYVPVAPRKEAPSETSLKLHLRYDEWFQFLERPASSVTEDLAGNIDVDVPEASVDFVPSGWPELVDPQGVRRLAGFGLYDSMPPIEELAVVDRLLVDQPEEMEFLWRKLRSLDRIDGKVADDFFASNLLDVASGHPIEYAHMARFLLRRAVQLARQEQLDAVDGLAQQTKVAWETEFAKRSQKPGNSADYWRKSFQTDDIGKLVAFPSKVRSLMSLPPAELPKILGATSTRDGFALVTIEEPRNEPVRWYSMSTPANSPWSYVTDFNEPREVWEAARKGRRLVVCQGEGGKLQLIATETSTLAPLLLPEVSVPAPSVDTLDGYLERQRGYLVRSDTSQLPAHDQLYQLGLYYERIHSFDLAAEVYERALGSLSESGEDLAAQQTKASIALVHIRALRRSGELNEALTRLENIMAHLPEQAAGAYTSYNDFFMTSIEERMEIAAAYLRLGDRERARELVEAFATTRPDYRTLSNSNDKFPKGFAGRTELMRPRGRAFYRYLPLDRMLLKLKSK